MHDEVDIELVYIATIEQLLYELLEVDEVEGVAQYEPMLALLHDEYDVHEIEGAEDVVRDEVEVEHDETDVYEVSEGILERLIDETEVNDTVLLLVGLQEPMVDDEVELDITGILNTDDELEFDVTDEVMELVVNVAADAMLHITVDEVEGRFLVVDGGHVYAHDEMVINEYSSLDTPQLADIVYRDELNIPVEAIQFIALLQTEL